MATRVDPVYGSVEVREKQCGVNAIRLVATSNEAGVAAFSVGLVGKFQRITIKPAAGGDIPTDLFDLAITDEHGVSLYASTTLTHDAVTVAYPSASNPILVYGSCLFTFANMGDKKKCEVLCYFEP